MLTFLKTYGKSIVAVLVTVVSAAVAARTGDSHIDPSEWVNVILLGAGAAAVFAAPNVPGARFTKVILAVITAVATAAVSLVNDGISATDLWQLGAAALGALGVLVAPYPMRVGAGEAYQFPK